MRMKWSRKEAGAQLASFPIAQIPPRWKRPLRLAAHGVTAALLLVLCFWLDLPEIANAAVAAIVSGTALAVCAPRRLQGAANGLNLGTAIFGSLTILLSIASMGELRLVYIAYYPAAVILLLAGVIGFSVISDCRGGFRSLLKLLALGWAGGGVLVWLAAAYELNQPALFLLAILALVALLIGVHFCFKRRPVVFQVVNSVALLALVLPLTNLFVQPAYDIQTNSRTREKYYSLAAAHRDPTAFARWWNAYVKQWGQFEKKTFVSDPKHNPNFRLRPGSEGMLFQSDIRINTLGFRGGEIARDKGAAYRIVALGESTTFGITLNASDKPWPEILEGLIRERLNPTRPVEVINAGVPGYQLRDSLSRFSSEILPLRPDMIISYHGINGFRALDPALPSTISAGKAPSYHERPVRLLANLEYTLKVRHVRNEQIARLKKGASKVIDPMASGCAKDYGRLCELTDAHGMRLAIANFSMALTRNSSPADIDFYQVGYPAARWFVAANEIHSRIVKQITREHPQVCFVNTHPLLDGVPDKFLDLVHFSPAGDHQMAENVYAAIEPLLKADLCASNSIAREH
jgi:lysophospholipase L1-like esterase